MQLKISAVSDKGCVRDHNEDMILIGDHIFRDNSEQIEIDIGNVKKYIIAIADGMGGHNAGEIASDIVLKKMAEKFNTLDMKLSELEIKQVITGWAKEIHNFMLNEGNNDLTKKGMGSTFIGVLFYEDKAFYMNVGDSRLYRFRRGNLMQISKDHSLSEVIGNKVIDSSLLINSFGGGEKFFIDFAPIGGKVLNEDILIVCSDGLTKMVPDDEIEQILTGETPIDKLLLKAKDNGGEDNISIIIATIYREE
ncbi:MAG: protein phosphatase 2C domain-containing protein [Deltaproteobacteria bacterium]|nr:protein phosphatase 2C domain-containing protein [Deltaproteobacteria bacterium]